MAAVAADAPVSLDAGYAQMYNLQFNDAHRTFALWSKAKPADPLGPVSDAAAYLFAEFDRLHILQSELFVHDDAFRSSGRLTPDPAAKAAFDTRLSQAEKLIAEALKQSPNDPNALFAQVLMLGLRSDYEGLIDKKYFSSLSTTKVGRATAQRLLAADPNCYDAWLAIGVENYLLSLKPLPVRWLLQLNGNATDKELGIEQLKVTAEKGRYLKPFAKLLLAVAALRDKNPAKGKAILSELVVEFPQNRLYADELARLH